MNEKKRNMNEKKGNTDEKKQKIITMLKIDYILLAALMLIYGAIAFYQLGDTQMPLTVWKGMENEEIIVNFGETVDVSDFMMLLGEKENRDIEIKFSSDGKSWQNYAFLYQEEDGSTVNRPYFTLKSVLKWEEVPIGITAQYIKIICRYDDTKFYEIGFLAEDNLIPIKSYAEKDNALFDEQHLVPKISTYLNSSYFDEIYHARTAMEFINKEPVYETTHPPLGKTLISLGIQLFGKTPFGWRFVGTLFGVLMIPFIYLFAKSMFDSTKWAVFAAFIFSFDFMHYTQTRIATIDTYVTFFIIGMYFFMYLYYRMNFFKYPLWKTFLPLLLSGIFMGLAISSKWQGVYAIAGLAFIFFYTLFMRYKEYKNTQINQRNQLYFKKKTIITLCSCVGFFIIIPLIIYCLSYIPYLEANGAHGFENSVRTIINNQLGMFSYHSTLGETHYFSSWWYEWPFITRPVFYYAQTFGSLKAGISTFGNPVVWWSGLLALLFCCYKYFTTKDKTLLFLLIAFASQYVPWILITRITYIYHYFPSIPFLVLMITFIFANYIKKNTNRRAIIFAVSTFVLFVLFYPVISGMPVPIDYINLLKWLPGWQFYV